MPEERTKRIDYVGGPLHGSSLDIPVNTTATQCAGCVYMQAQDDVGVFTPSGIPVARAQKLHAESKQ